MVAVPHTYAEWVNVLEQLKEGMKDEEVVAAMQQGTLEWQSGVSERFSQRLVDTVNFRLKRADDKFQKIYSWSGGQETGIAQALLSLRKELSLMKKCLKSLRFRKK